MVNQFASWQKLSLAGEKTQMARVELHWALQIVASVGATLLPWREDQEQTALHWDPRGWLVSAEAKPSKSLEAALNIGNMHLLFLAHPKGVNYDPVAEFTLPGHRLEDGYQWLEKQLADYLDHPLEHLRRLSELTWKLPHHPLEGGSIFVIAGPAFQELQRWYGNSHLLLNQLQQQYQKKSGRLLCWPQNLEQAFVYKETDRHLQLGFSAGNDELKEPYLFVRPLWNLNVHAQPQLGVGHWQQSEAVLSATDLLSRPDAASQQALAWRFYTEAMQRVLSLPHA